MRLPFVAVLLLFGRACLAQDPAPMPAQTPPGAALPGDELSLIPPTRPIPAQTTDSLARRKASTSTTAKTVDLMKEQVRLRQVKTIVSRHAAVLDAQERAAAARNEPERRAALRSYYTLLFAHMEQMDRSLAPRIAERRTRIFNLLNQKRLGIVEQDADLPETAD